jgi:hypothetical protein
MAGEIVISGQWNNGTMKQNKIKRKGKMNKREIKTNQMNQLNHINQSSDNVDNYKL